jgi:hypothetical protein
MNNLKENNGLRGDIVRIKGREGVVVASAQQANTVVKMCEQNGLWTLLDTDGKYPEDIKPVVELVTEEYKNGGITIEPYLPNDEEKSGKGEFMTLKSGDLNVNAPKDMINLVKELMNIGRTCVLKGPDGKLPPLIQNIISVLEAGETSGGVQETTWIPGHTPTDTMVYQKGASI